MLPPRGVALMSSCVCFDLCSRGGATAFLGRLRDAPQTPPLNESTEWVGYLNGVYRGDVHLLRSANALRELRFFYHNSREWRAATSGAPNPFKPCCAHHAVPKCAPAQCERWARYVGPPARHARPTRFDHYCGRCPSGANCTGTYMAHAVLPATALAPFNVFANGHLAAARKAHRADPRGPEWNRPVEFAAADDADPLVITDGWVEVTRSNVDFQVAKARGRSRDVGAWGHVNRARGVVM